MVEGGGNYSNYWGLLHQVSTCNSNDSSSLDQACFEQQCIINAFDLICSVERIIASPATLFCRTCEPAANYCDVNVSLVLSGIESIEGVFFARIPNLADCNINSTTSLIAEV